MSNLTFEHRLPWTRGTCCVALHNPKSAVNVGGALRAAHVFDASLVVVHGNRFMRSPTDVTKAYRSIPTLVTEGDIFDHIPFDCAPVAVDLLPSAISLDAFQHPQRAFYIFGPEDGTLGSKIHARCKYKVFVPANHCLNLAACVNVILYDRRAKELRSRRKS